MAMQHYQLAERTYLEIDLNDGTNPEDIPKLVVAMNGVRLAAGYFKHVLF